MPDNVILPGAGRVIETENQADGSQRQRFTLADVSAWLRVIYNTIVNPSWASVAACALRVTIVGASGTSDTLGSITTVGTVSTVTNAASIGGVAASSFILDTMTATWNSGVRSRIT